MNSIPCDVVLLPNEELSLKATAASQQLNAYDSLFTLEIGKFYPHMSLYMFQLNISDIPRVQKVLSYIAAISPKVRGTATTYALGEGVAVGYVDTEYEATNELRLLQDKVIEGINPVRAGMREKDVAKMQDATGVMLENFKKYGYPAAGTLFRPHITLTRLKDHKPEITELLSDVRTFDGTFDRVGLFEMGDNGTCIRKIAEYELGA
jgi:hypothetical protein